MPNQTIISAKILNKIVRKFAQKSEWRILRTSIVLLLVLQIVVPSMPIAHAVDPQPTNQPITSTKTYTANQLGTQIQQTVTLRAEPNGTIVFSHNGIESFRIFTPTGLIGSSSLLSNETYTVVEVRSGSNYIQEKWKLNAQKFKMELCWNLPVSTIIRLPLSRMDKFSNNIFTIRTLDFDWNDARLAGYNPKWENSTKSITVDVSQEGCLDPTIATTTISPATEASSEKIQYSAGRWYALICAGSLRVYSSQDGVTWNSGNTVSSVGVTRCERSGFYLDGNYIHVAWMISDDNFGYRRVSYTSGGILTNGTTVIGSMVSSCPIGGGDGSISLALNSTGFPFIVTSIYSHGNNPPTCDEGQMMTISLFMPNNINPTSFTRRNDINEASFQSGEFRVELVNVGSGRLRLIYTNCGAFNCASPSNLNSRIWYQNNQTFGNLLIVQSNVGLAGMTIFDCDSTPDNVVHCYYNTGSGVLAYKNFTLSGSLSTQVNVRSIGGAIDLTLSKGLNNNTLFFAVLDRTNDVIKWNRTSTNIAFIASGSVSVAPTAVGLAVGITSRQATDSWGYYTVTGSASPFDIVFDEMPFSIAICGADSVAGLVAKEFEHYQADSYTLIIELDSQNRLNRSYQYPAFRSSGDLREVLYPVLRISPITDFRKW